jgi:periplasmic divalent cation tolerance protein
MPFLIFYVTHPDEAAAQQFGQRLLERRLVACANIFPIRSAYFWEGGLQNDAEWVSILKTRLDLEATVESAARELHPYQTPCLLRYEVRANADYERWIEENTL